MIVNPVLAKELRDRVRTWRSPFLITIYLMALAGIGGLNYYFQTMYSFGGTQALRLGLMTFAFLAVVQLILIAFLAPGMTASIISGERERQTWALLLVTRLSPLSIVVGKLLSAISYIVLLILASTPIYSTIFLFGAVDMRNLLLIVLVSLVTTVTLASIGLFCSALFKRTITAIVISYLLTFFLFGGTLISAGVIQSLNMEKWSRLNQAPPTPFIVNFNPLVALGSALPEGVEIVPFSRSVVRSTAVLTSNGQTMPTQVKPVEPRPVWQVNLMLDALIILVCLGLTVWLIRPLRAGNKKGG
ncbi:MAG: ABC transporter permease subunit [Desulfosporosinus sp.]|nr:ABC transporter permease subunit [Desulfosporosinus sp.]